jgi:hypothetical protein
MRATIQMPDWQAGFMDVLPVIKTHAEIQFHKLPDVHREEATQEAVAAACVSYCALARKGRLQVAHPSTLATYAIKHVRSGRHVGGHQDAARDVLSPVAHRRHGLRLRSICTDSDCDGGWQYLLIAGRRVDVGDLAALRIDFRDWVSTFPRRDRRIIGALASGDRTSAVAKRFGITEGRVSQLRRRYERHWSEFQGESKVGSAN